MGEKGNIETRIEILEFFISIFEKKNPFKSSSWGMGNEELLLGVEFTFILFTLAEQE